MCVTRYTWKTLRCILQYNARNVMTSVSSKLLPALKSCSKNNYNHCWFSQQFRYYCQNPLTNKCNFVKPEFSSRFPIILPLTRRKCVWKTFKSFPMISIPRKQTLHPNFARTNLLNCEVNYRYICSNGSTTETDVLAPDSPQFLFYLEELLKEFADISQKLSSGVGDEIEQQKIVKRRQKLEPVVEKIQELNAKKLELEDVKSLLEDDDPEMQRLAQVEKKNCLNAIEELEDELVSELKPTSEIDDNDIVVELTAGVGGQEAMLFTSDVFNMYQNYAQFKRWRFNTLAYTVSDLGGVRHASVSMQGPDVYKLMKYEGGVHRVQRIPKTEKSGRVHTSTMTVAVLPQPKQIDLQLDAKDLRIETKKASGAGGQHVNTTDSAVRIVHIPTGISAESQQERSQHKNRHIAMTMLHARIYKKQLEEQESKEKQMRTQQVGTSGRSEKIRTYNFNQDRITDHRISMNTFDVEGFLNGGELLDGLVSELCYQDEMDILRNTIENVFKDHHPMQDKIRK
ncbi:peptide chain release factor 1-like, mitochondrial [Antedon mediterranea]|uniref:peptide chain release factor 1-like, mitochondrial n=1 Tax=Antedon mediterranea TaxID=105859 RepID=UPI003AF4A1A6